MHTFLLWMRSNVLAAQGALLQALAYRDDLQFVQAPKIHREYMDRIGQFEQEAMVNCCFYDCNRSMMLIKQTYFITSVYQTGHF